MMDFDLFLFHINSILGRTLGFSNSLLEFNRSQREEIKKALCYSFGICRNALSIQNIGKMGIENGQHIDI